MRSPVVEEWRNEGRRESRRESLVEVLSIRFGDVPSELVAAVQEVDDLDKLTEWYSLSNLTPSLAQFRTDAGL